MLPRTQPAPASPTVLVVEDDWAVADAVATGLTDEGMSVTLARDGAEGEARLDRGGWGLVVLDWMLPRVDGLTLLGRFRARDPVTPVLLLTARDAVGDRVAGLRTGADDYLCKPFAFDEFVARIRALLRRSRAADPAPIGFLDITADPVARKATRGGYELGLGGRAFDLLVYFLRNPNVLLSRRRLFEGIWGEPFDPQSRTLDVHLVELRRQLELHGPRVVHNVRGYGYRFSEHPGEAGRP
ncbi:MAG TPA: response regulator transcription factor [Urbifossiella sp.]|nr:response regulator transcription factor [Urbifossiella sp.]